MINFFSSSHVFNTDIINTIQINHYLILSSLYALLKYVREKATDQPEYEVTEGTAEGRILTEPETDNLPD